MLAEPSIRITTSRGPPAAVVPNSRLVTSGAASPTHSRAMTSIRSSISQNCSKNTFCRVLVLSFRNCMAAQSTTSNFRRLNRWMSGGTTTAARPNRSAAFRKVIPSSLHPPAAESHPVTGLQSPLDSRSDSADK